MSPFDRDLQAARLAEGLAAHDIQRRGRVIDKPASAWCAAVRRELGMSE